MGIQPHLCFCSQQPNQQISCNMKLFTLLALIGVVFAAMICSTSAMPEPDPETLADPGAHADPDPHFRKFGGTGGFIAAGGFGGRGRPFYGGGNPYSSYRYPTYSSRPNYGYRRW